MIQGIMTLAPFNDDPETVLIYPTIGDPYRRQRTTEERAVWETFRNNHEKPAESDDV